MSYNKVKSDTKVQKIGNDVDVSCWNCLSVEKDDQEPVNLKQVRKQHREKLKLYAFLASELSRPKSVPLKQKISEPYIGVKKINDKVTKEITNIAPDLNELQNTRTLMNSEIVPIDSDDNVKVIYQLRIEKPSSIEERTDNIKKVYSKASNYNVKKQISVGIDKVDASSNESESGYAESIGPSDGTRTPPEKNNYFNSTSPNVRRKRDVDVSEKSNEKPIIDSNSLEANSKPVNAKFVSKTIKEDRKKYLEEKVILQSPKCTASDENTRGSLQVLNSSTKELKLSSESLQSERGYTLTRKTPGKSIRWSSLSICKKPFDIDDEVYSENLSPGSATLPRRSNSPLPHERDLERDRFPINRSGLQARSESMASVYSGAGEGTRGNLAVRGEIQFSLLYNYRLGALEVGVKRCRDLAAADTKRNRSDPYVKVYLLPDKSKAGKRKTKVKKNTLNPVFEETLSFVQPLASLSARTLWLSVWHADMFGRNDFLGEVTLPLADVVFDDPAPTWHKLHERTEQFDEAQGTRGDLIIGLKFEMEPSARAKGTLHVLVKEAKNLIATKPNGLADVFCKSYLLPERGRLAKQKTSVVRRTLSPRWEHTFTYRGLTLQELATRALELSLWDRDRLASNDFMGAIRLSLGTGTYMGASVNWMDSVGKEVSLWQTMMQRPNFWVEGSLPLRPQLSN